MSSLDALDALSAEAREIVNAVQGSTVWRGTLTKRRNRALKLNEPERSLAVSDIESARQYLESIMPPPATKKRKAQDSNGTSSASLFLPEEDEARASASEGDEGDDFRDQTFVPPASTRSSIQISSAHRYGSSASSSPAPFATSSSVASSDHHSQQHHFVRYPDFNYMQNASGSTARASSQLQRDHHDTDSLRSEISRLQTALAASNQNLNRASNDLQKANERIDIKDIELLINKALLDDSNQEIARLNKLTFEQAQEVLVLRNRASAQEVALRSLQYRANAKEDLVASLVTEDNKLASQLRSISEALESRDARNREPNEQNGGPIQN